MLNLEGVWVGGGGAQKKGGLYTTKFDNSPCVATTFQKTLFFINYKN